MVMRITGLGGSGLDIDQMVKDLMKAKRVNYDKLVQKKTQLEWKKTDYNNMYTSMNDFRSKTLFNYKTQNTLMPKQVTSSDEKTVTVTANADAITFTHSINITQLAESASMASTGPIQTGANKDTLSDHIGVTGKIKLNISDGTKSIELSNTLDGTGYDTTGKSIYDLVSDINKLGLNVKASYDATLDRFFLSNTKSGAASKVVLTSSDGTGTGAGSLAEKLKLNSSAVVTTEDADSAIPPVINPTFRKGKDAQFDLDGIIGLTKDSNQFMISGVSYNLKAKGTATATVSSDNEKVVANVKAFIEEYNTMLGKVNTELNEKIYKDFLPLTDAQKKDMNEADIKAWEEKAKSGMLHRDPIFQDLVNKMRNNISTPIEGLSAPYNSASSIGINTGNWQEGGKLYLDETKLRKALDKDPEVVNKIFGTGNGTNGIAVKLYDNFKEISEKIVKQAGTAGSTYDTTNSMGKTLNMYKKQLIDMDTKLKNAESAYYARFTAMETAISRMSKQSSWFSQQAGK